MKKQETVELVKQAIAEAIAPMQQDIAGMKIQLEKVSETVTRIEGERIGREKLLNNFFRWGGWIVAVGVLVVHTLNYQGCFTSRAMHQHPIHQSAQDAPPTVTQDAP